LSPQNVCDWKVGLKEVDGVGIIGNRLLAAVRQVLSRVSSDRKGWYSAVDTP
jgi:hypothetical protein